VGVQGVDRGARKRLVRGEQPAKGFLVLEPAVVQHRERPGQALDDLLAVDEGGGDRAVPARPGNGDELAVAEELLDPADGETKPCGYLRE
jgi:hypothetical protein